MSDIKDYNIDLQKLFLEFLVQDKELFVRVNGILDSSYFDRTLKKSVDFVKTHVSDYGALPTIEQIKATTGVSVNDIGKDINERHKEWFIDETQSIGVCYFEQC
jgi:hypothetical protein